MGRPKRIAALEREMARSKRVQEVWDMLYGDCDKIELPELPR